MTKEMDLLREFRSGLPAPTAAARERAHAYATGQTQSSRRPLLLRGLRSPGTRRARSTVVAAACVALAAGLSFALIPQSSGRAPRGGGGDLITGIMLNPDGPFVGSTVRISDSAPAANATLQIKVLQVPNDPGTDPESETTQVVYSETVPMTEAYAGGTTAGDNPLSTWSGTLSTSDWAGGCQSGFLYAIEGTGFTSDGKAITYSRSQWLTCQTGTSGT